MRTGFRIALGCFGLAYLFIAVYGVRYLCADEFMSYHATAIGTDWQALPDAYQTLLMALIKVAGGGLFAVSLAGAVLLWALYRDHQNWIRWTLLVLGATIGAATLYATLSVAFSTPASPPWFAPALGLILVCIGFVLSSGSRATAVS